MCQGVRTAFFLAVLAALIPTSGRADSSAPMAIGSPREQALFADAWKRLPPSVREALTDKTTHQPIVTLRRDGKGDSLPSRDKFCNEGQLQGTLELARFEPRLWDGGGDLVVNPNLADHYTPDAPDAAPLSCRHGSLHRVALAAVLHEMAHAYEAQARRSHWTGSRGIHSAPSSDPEFLRKAAFVPGWFWSSNKNTNPQRSPDHYEVSSAREAFAVNFEYFLLDSTYACRRPSLFRFLSKALKFDPFPGRTCRTNTKVFVFSESSQRIRDLDPDRIYQIDYLLASPGTEMVSRWGHGMLRLAICAPERFDSLTSNAIPATPYGPLCLENTMDHVVVSYRADLRGFNPGIRNLVSQRFPSRLFLYSFDDVFREYLYGDLRDLVAHPLVLDGEEKRELVERILESNWGYEGDYHFLNSNCATETRDLLASVKVGPGESNPLSAWSPLGVRDQGFGCGWIQKGEGRTYPSLLPVLKRIWTDGKIKDRGFLESDEHAQRQIVEYMKQSKANDRWARFQERLPASEGRREVLRDYIVMESQILRLEEELVKEDVFSLGRNHAPGLLNTLDSASRVRPDRMHPGSYGIPLESEVALPFQDAQSVEGYRRAFKALHEALREQLSGRILEIEATRRNLHQAFSLNLNMPADTHSKGKP